MVRRRGVLTSVRHLRAGDHVCWSHTGGDEHRTMLESFFADGLANDEMLAYFAPASLRAELPERIGDARTSGLVRDGRMTLLPGEDAFRPDGSFDDDGVLERWAALTREAAAAGFTALRAAGEAGWLLSRVGPDSGSLGYELHADLLAAAAPLVALCSYDTRVLDGASLGLARSMHPLVLGPAPAASDAGYALRAVRPGVVAIDGELDVRFAEVVGDVLVAAARHVHTLDITQLRFADVASVRAIARAARAALAATGTARIVGASPSFRTTWNLLGAEGATEVAFIDA